MLALILSAQLLAVSAALQLNVDTAHGTLTLEGRQREGPDAFIAATFRSQEGDGIRFRSTEESLVMTDLNGNNLISFYSLPSMQTYSGEAKVMMYELLDEAYVEADRRTWKFSKEDLTEGNAVADIFSQTGDLEDPEAALRASFDAVAEQPAIRLLEPAAQALGEDLGIIGKDEPSIMAFYATAMKLTETYDKNRREMVTMARAPNPWEMYISRRVNIQAYPDCDLTTCPPCQDDQCIGLCGKGCDCWSWVCGDCCFHEGCKDHDLCCSDWYSFSCLMPYYFECESPYEC